MTHAKLITNPSMEKTFSLSWSLQINVWSFLVLNKNQSCREFNLKYKQNFNTSLFNLLFSFLSLLYFHEKTNFYSWNVQPGWGASYQSLPFPELHKTMKLKSSMEKLSDKITAKVSKPEELLSLCSWIHPWNGQHHIRWWNFNIYLINVIAFLDKDFLPSHLQKPL